MNAEIRKRIKALGAIEDSSVERILRASRAGKGFLFASILTGDSESNDPAPDQIEKISVSFADSKFGILATGMFVMDPPMRVSDGFTFPIVYDRLVSEYSKEGAVVCTYGMFTSSRLTSEINRYHLTPPAHNPGWFKDIVSVEYVASALLGLKPGDDRSIRSIMKKLDIEPFEGSYYWDYEDTHALVILQDLFRGVL